MIESNVNLEEKWEWTRRGAAYDGKSLRLTKVSLEVD